MRFSAAALLLWISQVFGFVVRGVVVDENGNPIPAAHVYLPEQGVGACADIDGNFLINLVSNGESGPIASAERGFAGPAAIYRFQVSAVGYAQKDTLITITSDTTLRFVLPSQAVVAEPVVVSASRVEQRLLDAPTTTTAVPGDALANTVVTGLDDAMRYVPGVAMNKYQISIRNSSGYSQGAGSRVTMMIDGVPVLAGDTGEIKWDALPTAAVNQVEVVKGAGSSLYGSGALGGVVNVITQTPRKRTLKLWTKLGAYDKPYWPQWDWSDRIRTIKSAGFLWGGRRRKIAYLLTADATQNDSYREGDDSRRGKAFAKMHWDLSHNRSLSAFVDAAYEDRASYFQWKSLEEALRIDPQRKNDRVWSTKLFSAVTYRGDAPQRRLFFKAKLYHIFGNWSSRIYNTDLDQYECEASCSNKLGADAQVMFTWKKNLFSCGAEASFATNNSVTFGDHIGAGGALFAQDEISYLHPLVLTVGFRYDVFWVDSADVGVYSGLSPKVAAVYHLSEHSALRASLSSGFRIPTMAELFTRTNAGGIIRVQPNAGLKPERGYTAELGANYIKGENLVDAALFYNYYNDMIEPIAIYGTTFQFNNRREVRIYGFEITGRASIKGFNLSANYLYTDSRDLDANEKLPYRPDHTASLTAEYTVLGHLTLSLAWRYRSEFEYGLYTADPKVDQKVLDLQAKYSAGRLRLAFRVNNALNYCYTDIERNLAPIRHFVFTAEFDVY